MKKTTWTIFSVIIFSLLFSTGCTVNKKAITIRTHLAVETEYQLNRAAEEVDQLIKYTMAQQAEAAYAQLSQKYQTLINSIRLQYNDNPKLLIEESAKAGADYVRGQEKTKEFLKQETERLYVLVNKIKVGAKAVNEINEMANQEVLIQQDLLDQVINAGLEESLEALFTTIQEKYTPTELKDEIPTLPATLQKNIPAIP